MGSTNLRNGIIGTMEEFEANFSSLQGEAGEKWKRIKEKVRSKDTTDKQLRRIRQQIDNLFSGGIDLDECLKE